MRANDYQHLAMKYCPVYDERETLMYGAMGLCGEAGEASEIVKKHLFQGHELDRQHLIREMGDVAWYLACLCYCVGTDMETVFETNIQKLRERYPDGYNDHDSINRKPGDV